MAGYFSFLQNTNKIKSVVKGSAAVMELVRRINRRNNQSIIARCEKCGRETIVPYANTLRPHMPSIELKEVIRCECGEYHNLIVAPKNNGNVRSGIDSLAKTTTDESLKCPKCGSVQFYAGDKGFGLGKAAVGGALLGPVGLLGGLIGSKKTMITCLKCGHKWQAGKV